MRTLARTNLFAAFIFIALGLLMHFIANTSEWKGFPYRADQVEYPYAWMSNAAIFFVAAGVVSLIYGILFSAFAVAKQADDLDYMRKLSVLDES